MDRIIKVCGMKYPENIREVEALGIDLMGFIFYGKSSRFVGETAPEYLPSGCGRVGVFVNADEDYIVSMATEFGLGFVQLHGGESPQFCRSLATRLPSVRLIKAFSIGSADDLGKTEAYEGEVSYFLFDTPTTGYGGSGKGFDWTVLDSYHGQTPFLLSGGIGPDSVQALAGFHHPQWCGIDLNSRFETQPALKNAAALKDFINRINEHKNE